MRLMLDNEPSSGANSYAARETAAQRDAFELSPTEWTALRNGDNGVRRRVFADYA